MALTKVYSNHSFFNVTFPFFLFILLFSLFLPFFPFFPFLLLGEGKDWAGAGLWNMFDQSERTISEKSCFVWNSHIETVESILPVANIC